MLAEPPRPTRSIFQARCYRVPDLLSDRRVPAAATRSPGKADEQIRTADLLITNQRPFIRSSRNWTDRLMFDEISLDQAA
jgi:hypothetical protein